MALGHDLISLLNWFNQSQTKRENHMSKKKDYFYNGSYKSFSGLRAQEIKSQANGLYTIMFFNGQTLSDVRRESLFTRKEVI